MSYADVVFRSPAQMKLPGVGETSYYDINGDGLGDFSRTFQGVSTTDIPSSAGSLNTTYTGTSGLQFLLDAGGGTFGYDLLGAGDVVGQQPLSEWSTIANPALRFNYAWRLYQPELNGYRGISETVREAWVGFRLSVEDEIFYGVLHIDLYLAAIGGSPGQEIGGLVNLIGAYIQTSPNTPLTISDGFVVVPEPGSISLIAAGVAALLAAGIARRRA